MGRRLRDVGDGSPARATAASLTSPPSPCSSSASSSDFEFAVPQSPTSKRAEAAQLCPADELFYKGQLLPLQLSPRISMVRTLILASSSTSASDSSSNSRDSNGSSSSSSFSADLLLPDSSCDSSRPSSASASADDPVVDPHILLPRLLPSSGHHAPNKRPKYFSSFATRFSSVFLHRGSTKKDSSSAAAAAADHPPAFPSAFSKRPTSSSSSLAKEVIKKYVKKVKPLYEMLSSLPQKQSTTTSTSHPKKNFSFSIKREKLFHGPPKKAEYLGAADCIDSSADPGPGIYYPQHSNSFSGSLGYPRHKRCVASCPSSMRSSPSHSGLLSIGGAGFPDLSPTGPVSLSSASSMEELQRAIEGAIAHCKSTMILKAATAAAPPAISDGRELDVHVS